ncbi:glycosyltransferase [Bowmanella sp. JS7-9]|uniref:Glycosyltransferase n=1 Tax=Pseudobowmanella zhangzhouensis TaxID=1537679 RepID=A0ABW1XHN4_9ALTE|nr:glycosyltransferase [Bowmanella sp. JS7-9]TBX24679.1 hypothetical protein TK45_04445 [Bowmanella sp. JS7-9]
MTIQVQLIQHLRPGGIESMALDLCRLRPAGHVHIIALEGNKDDAVRSWPALEKHRAFIHCLNKAEGFSFATLWRLIILLKRIGASALHSHHVGPLVYGGLAARLLGLTHVHTEHDAWHLKDQKRRRLQQRILAWSKPILVADAREVAQNCARFLPHNRYNLIRNGIDTQRFTPGDKLLARRALGLPEGAHLIGCAARLESVKGVDIAIDALACLSPGIHLTIAGSGSMLSALQEQVSRLNLDERVHWLGHCEDMPAFYQALDLFCLSSRQEGMPLSLLEAQACDVPCVASHVGGTQEAVCPKTGALVPAEDATRLAAALAAMLLNPPSGSPRQFVLEQADVRRMVAAYDRLFTTEALYV